ncbi:MAG TPA: lysophospholipid acyltransferase family protein [Steroidobacteraceae bacterium]|nr:lysophospholipid acyltransferase family protein [Steroidobacteraceae bacterium]
MLRALRTVYGTLALYASLMLLAVICLAWTALALPLYFVLPEKSGTACGRYGIMLGFRAYAWTLTFSGAYRLDLREMDELREASSLILAPNHPSLIDALLILTRHPNVTCVMKSELMKSPFLGAGSRLARYVKNDSPLRMVKQSMRHLRRGGVLLMFPEGTRTTRLPINALSASIGLIAKRADVPVQTLLIETDSPFLSKGWPLLRRPALPITYRVRLGKRFPPPADPTELACELDRYFREALEEAPQSRWLTSR